MTRLHPIKFVQVRTTTEVRLLRVAASVPDEQIPGIIERRFGRQHKEGRPPHEWRMLSSEV